MAKKKIVILSGAGVSAESGLQTFRDSGGLWEGYDVMEVASVGGFASNPQLVLDFYNMRRRELSKVQPNAAHLAIAELEKDFDVVVVTQNVDDLHERAGSSRVIHLHGELLKSRSVKDARKIFDCTGDIHLGDLAPDGGQLRPHIVWFGEVVDLMNDAEEEVITADALIVVGTSLQVYPAAGLIGYVKRNAPIFIIDPSPNKENILEIEYIEEPATRGIPIAIKKIKEKFLAEE